MGLVSLVTLTRTGEPGDLPVSVEPSGVDVAGAVGGAVAEVQAAPPAASSKLAGGQRLGTDPLPTLATLLADRDRAPADRGGESLGRPAGAPAQALAALPLSGPADRASAGESGPAAPGVDAGLTEVDALATASGPWLLLAGLVGAVTLYVRKRQMAARRTATADLGAAARPLSGLSRRWGLRLRARTRLAHSMRPMSPIPVPRDARVPAAPPRPRHLNNS
jgi:hypothetical protein